MANVANRRSEGSGSFLRRLFGGRAIIGLVALVLALIFIFQNNENVRIHFIFFTAHSRLWVGFLLSLVFGALLGQALLAFRRSRARSARGGEDDVTTGPSAP